MDAVDSVWSCTQAVVDDRGPDDDGKEKTDDFGCIVLNDMVDNERYVLKEGDNTIGRHPLNHIYIKHPSVSSNHAVIQCGCDGVVLMDKGSLNKTKLNKKTLKKYVNYFLDENALLMFGEVRANYCVNGGPSETVNESNDISAQNTSEDVGVSKSDLYNSVITSVSSPSEMKIKVPETVTESEYTKNTTLDHEELNSSSPTDQFLLSAVSQIEAMESNRNSSETVHNVREETPSPVMDLTGLMSSIISDKNSKNFSKNNCSIKNDNAVAPVSDLQGASNVVVCDIIREDTPSPTLDLESPLLDTSSTVKREPEIVCQSPEQMSARMTREDTPSPVMDLGIFDIPENRLSTIEINNRIIHSISESTNNVSDLDETQFLEVDNNILEYLTQKPPVENILNKSIQQSVNQSTSKLADSTSVTFRQNTTKHHFNAFEADDDDIFSSFVEQESQSQTRDIISHNADDFFNFPTQDISLTKEMDFKTEVPSATNEIETQELPQPSKVSITTSKMENEDFFNCPTQTESVSEEIKLRVNVSSTVNETETQQFLQLSEISITSKTSTTNTHEDLTEIQKRNDKDFFNCPTQKVSTFKKLDLKQKCSSTVHEAETQEISELPTNKTNISTAKTNTNDMHEDLIQVPEIDDENFFNCCTQKLSTFNKINLKQNSYSTKHEAKTQTISQLLSNINSSKTSTNNIHKDLIETQKRDDEDFFSCPTQKVSAFKKLDLKQKCSSTIHEAETQEIPELPANKTNISTAKTNINNICEDLAQVLEMGDEDFFNYPTQKLSTFNEENLKQKCSSTIHEAETQNISQFLPNKINLSTSKTSTNNVHEDLTQVPEMDDEDCFSCPTQKVTIPKNNDLKRNILSTIPASVSQPEKETQEFLQPSKTNIFTSKTNAISMHKNLTETQERDDEDFFNCPTQKLTTFKKLDLKQKCSSTIHEAETQEISELSTDKTNLSAYRTSTNNICEDLTQLPEMEDEDFFSCPTQKVSTFKKLDLKQKCSLTVHVAETQKISELQTNKTNLSMYKISTNTISEDLTEVPEMKDEDFFNCPTQKVTIFKKNNLKANVFLSAMHETETQDFLQPSETNIIISKTSTTNTHENLTEIQNRDDEDFFNCPTQKVSIFKKLGLKRNCSSTVHEAETQEISELPINKTNLSTYKTNTNSICKNLTQVPEMEDEDFFNCPTQKVTISKNNLKANIFLSAIHEAETQEFLQPSETNIIISKKSATSIHEKQEIDDDDFFNCPTQKVSISRNVNSPTSTKRQDTDALDVNDTETQNLLFQSNSTVSVSKMNSPNEMKQNKENISDQTTQKVQTTIHSNTVLYKCINSDVDVSEDSIDSCDKYKSIDQKRNVVPDQTDERKIKKSKCMDLNTVSKLNSQLPVVCDVNQSSSKSPKTNKKPTIRVRKDLQTSCSISLSNILSNETNNKSIQNVLLNNDTANENIGLRSCLKTINNGENSVNIVSLKEKPLTDEYVARQVLNRHKRQSLKVNETVFSPFNTPNISVNSSSEQQLTPSIPIEGYVDSLNSEHSISLGDRATKWQSLWDKVSQKPGGKYNKQLNDVKNTNEIVVKKERYQTRAITRKENSIELNRKRKQDSVSVDESNKKICNEDRTRVLLVDPLIESCSETVVTFSYLRNRHLKEMKQFIDKTGGSVTDEITQCTVLVTDKIRCTMKILSAIAKGCPIVNTNWIKHSYAVSSFQDVSEFIIMDKDAERKYNFQLKKSLAKARTNRLLDGYTVLVTPSVKPGPKDMKVIITCAGGDYVINWPNTRVRNELIVTCEQDRRQWKPVWNNDAAKIIDSDALVMSIIRQKLIV